MFEPLSTTTSANYGLEYFDQSSLIWALVVGIIMSFLLGVAMGANDVANSFATAVGSGTLSIYQAYVLATVFESLGSMLVGWQITNTLRTGVIDVEEFYDEPKSYFLGQVAIIGGCSLWLLIATALNMPVSSQHSLVGATIGFTVVLKGWEGIRTQKLKEIVISWFVSPVLSGIISVILYMMVDFAVLRRRNPFECGLLALPFFYFICISFSAFMTVHKGADILRFDLIPTWAVILIAIEIGLIVSVIVYFAAIPHMRKRIKVSPYSTLVRSRRTSEGLGRQPQLHEINGIGSFIEWLLPDRNRLEDSQALQLSSSIQVFTSCFMGFAHGATDVGDIIAPLFALVSTFRYKSSDITSEVNWYILVYGVVAIIVGLWALGHHTIGTVGTKVSKINPVSGFTIEFGAAIVALSAGKIGMPIDQTHCVVGSVVAVGCLKSGEGIKWKLFFEIISAWIITLPISALISAGIMYTLKRIYL